jgi:RPA family protein
VNQSEFERENGVLKLSLRVEHTVLVIVLAIQVQLVSRSNSDKQSEFESESGVLKLSLRVEHTIIVIVLALSDMLVSRSNKGESE